MNRTTAIYKAANWKRQGYTVREIANFLNESGYVSERTGKPLTHGGIINLINAGKKAKTTKKTVTRNKTVRNNKTTNFALKPRTTVIKNKYFTVTTTVTPNA